jgi:rod shape-determining protein MreC
MTRHSNKTSKRMLFTYFMLGGGIFLFTPPSVTGKLQLAYAHVFSGPLRTGVVWTTAGQTLPQVANTVNTVDHTKQQKIQQRLRNHVATLQARLEKAQSKIDGLSGLRSVPEWNRMKFQQAGIINDPGQAQGVLLINRGREDGVTVGQFVLGDYSVIGVVSDVSTQAARVRLITDPGSKIGVRVAGAEARGVMQGRGPGTAAIPRVYAKEQPKAGDQVYAWKTPGFPEVPIVTAEVVDSVIDADSAMVWKITVRPVCDIANLRDVYVVIRGK